MLKRFLILIIATIVTLSVAMADAVGTWKLYPSYANVTGVEPTGSKVYVLADGNLYSYNVKTEEIREYNISTNPALSSRDITHIVWVKATNKLLIVYADYMIDVLSAKDDITSIVGLKNVSSQKDKTVKQLSVSGQYVYITTGLGIVKIDTKDEYIVTTYKPDEEVDGMPEIIGSTTTKDGPDGTVYYDSTNKCWWGANAESKLTKYIESDGTIVAASSGVAPDGAISSNCWRIYKHDGKIFVVAGACGAAMPVEYSFRPGFVQYYDGSSWTMLESPGEMTGYKYIAADCMAFDPRDKNHFWVGALSGLYEYRDYKPVRAFNSQNSTLTPTYNSDISMASANSLVYDRNYNLWVLNGWCNNMIHCYTSAGEWKSYNHSDSYSFDNNKVMDLQGAFISSTNGLMWWVNNYWGNNVLYSYNYENDKLSGITSFTNQDGVPLTPDQMYFVKEDLEGNVWVTTRQGPFYLSEADIRSGKAVFTQHKVNRNDGTGLADYLLAGVEMRCLAFDKANRKWFGTSNRGVYLISSDNNTQLEHFTTENSNLPSDVIYDIYVDDELGMVWFATDRGICSYQSDVVESYGDLSSDNVYAYPNPIEPDFTGSVTIMGLTHGSQVTITTPSGYVVNKGTCSGGMYQWNCCDLAGRRVASGVYNVLVATNEGESGCVTKIAVIR